MISLQMIRHLLWAFAILVIWTILVEMVQFIFRCLYMICAFLFIWFCLAKIIDITQQSNNYFKIQNGTRPNFAQSAYRYLFVACWIFVPFAQNNNEISISIFIYFRMVVIWIIGSADDADNGIAFEDSDYFLLAVVVLIVFLCRCLVQNL